MQITGFYFSNTPMNLVKTTGIILPPTKGSIACLHNDISRVLNLGDGSLLNSHIEGTVENNCTHSTLSRHFVIISGQLVPGRGVTEEVEILSRASVGNQPHGPNAVSPVLTGSMGSTTGY